MVLKLGSDKADSDSLKLVLDFDIRDWWHLLVD